MLLTFNFLLYSKICIRFLLRTWSASRENNIIIPIPSTICVSISWMVTFHNSHWWQLKIRILRKLCRTYYYSDDAEPLVTVKYAGDASAALCIRKWNTEKWTQHYLFVYVIILIRLLEAFFFVGHSQSFVFRMLKWEQRYLNCTM